MRAEEEPSVIERTRRPIVISQVTPEEPKWITLGLTMQYQKYTNWCWAAVAASVAAYCRPTNAVLQCEIANVELDRTDCCNPEQGTLPYINVQHMLGSALQQVGCLAEESPHASSREEVRRQINEKRQPVCALIIWSQDEPSHGAARSGSHFVTITGYRTDSNALLIADPLFGPMIEIAFEQFCTEYQVGAGRWAKTYYVTCDMPSGGAGG
jgi:hypothetical protein